MTVTGYVRCRIRGCRPVCRLFYVSGTVDPAIPRMHIPTLYQLNESIPFAVVFHNRIWPRILKERQSADGVLPRRKRRVVRSRAVGRLSGPFSPNTTYGLPCCHRRRFMPKTQEDRNNVQGSPLASRLTGRDTVRNMLNQVAATSAPRTPARNV